MSDMKTNSYCFVGQNIMGEAALASLQQHLGSPCAVFTRPSKNNWVNPVILLCQKLKILCIIVPYEEADLSNPSHTFILSQSEIGICCGWPVKISLEAITAPEQKMLNLHPGDLPVWAGSDPIGWHLASGNKPIICTVHEMTDVFDTGPILANGAIEIDLCDDAASLRKKCGQLLGSLVSTAINDGNNRNLKDFYEHDFQKAVPPRGVRPALNSEEMTMATVERVVRAFSPYPGVVVRHNSQWLLVAHPASAENPAVSIKCLDGQMQLRVLP